VLGSQAFDRIAFLKVINSEGVKLLISDGDRETDGTC
jgi:hypothetical protein